MKLQNKSTVYYMYYKIKMYYFYEIETLYIYYNSRNVLVCEILVIWM